MQINVQKKSYKKLPSFLSGISDIGITNTISGEKNQLSSGRDESKDDIYDYLGESHRMHNSHMSGDDLYVESPTQIPNYEQRKRKLHVIASHTDVIRPLKIMTDDAIVYDEYGKFTDLKIKYNDLKDELVDEIQSSFDELYSILDFDNGSTAWEYWYKWMIEGFLAFEIIWNDLNKPTEVEEVVEIDPNTLYPAYRIDQGKKVKVWLQRSGRYSRLQGKEKVIPDNSIIMIAYNRTAGNKGKLSYVESLERSFNMMRIMEDTKVGWHIMNAQWRTKILVPINTRSEKKARAQLGKVRSSYEEQIHVNGETGEYEIDGNKRLNFSKTMVLPRRDSAPEIDNFNGNGPDLSRPDMNYYFQQKYIRDTSIPATRFDRDGRGATSVLFQADGIPFDELIYYRDISRLRNEFGSILTKPIKLQFLTNHAEYGMDRLFRNAIGLKYQSNSMIEEAKRRELENRDLQHIQNMQRLQYPNGKPVWSTEFLIKEYMDIDEDKWKENTGMLEKELPDEDDDSGGGRRSRF